MNESPLTSLSNQIADTIDRIAPSVVQVQGRRRPASGVVYGDGLVLTTTRALGRDDRLHVRTPDGRVLDAELGGWDPTTSLVLLHVADLAVAPAAPAASSPRVGHLAFAVARSWSNAVTATSGIVAVIGGPLPTGHGRSIDQIIRTTAPMHGGFAGGALVDTSGAIIGVATAAEIRGLGVVIPADIAWKAAASLAEHGTRRRGYLGIAGQPVRLPDRQRATEDRDRGLLVVDVSSDSPAESGGILVGDVIIAFDEQPVTSSLDLLELLQGDRVGRTVDVRLLRGGAAQTVPVTVGTRASH